MLKTLALLLVLLLAGCASDPSPPPSTTPSVTPAPTPGGIWAGFVEVTLAASRTTIRAGEPVDLNLSAMNHRERSVWTNPGYACSGTWDMRLMDASGNELRIDDRDALGCPSGGPLTVEIAPGEDASVTYTWDGWLRPQLGQTQPPPPGTYTFVGTVGYANDSATSADLGRGSASIKIRVE